HRAHRAGRQEGVAAVVTAGDPQLAGQPAPVEVGGVAVDHERRVGRHEVEVAHAHEGRGVGRRHGRTVAQDRISAPNAVSSSQYSARLRAGMWTEHMVTPMAAYSATTWRN